MLSKVKTTENIDSVQSYLNELILKILEREMTAFGKGKSHSKPVTSVDSFVFDVCNREERIALIFLLN